MSSTYAGDPDNYPTDITIADDSDPRDAASMAVPLEGLADRTAYAQKRAFTECANIAALKALTGMATGARALVNRVGVFVYTDPSATTELQPYVISPTVGTGRWFHVIDSLRNTALGLAQLNASSKVEHAQIQNAIVTHGYLECDRAVSTLAFGAAAAFTAVPSTTLTLSGVLENDILEFEIAGAVYSDSSGVGLFARAVCGAGSTTIPADADTEGLALLPTGSSSRVPFHIVGSYTCTGADEAIGDVTVALQARVTGGVAGAILGCAVRGRVIRP